MKKSTKSRKELLLKAWLEMATTHRPDLQNIRSKSNKHPSTIRQAAYMWPYINLKDLSKPKVLYLQLEKRTKSTID
jgi:hypothetical protein